VEAAVGGGKEEVEEGMRDEGRAGGAVGEEAAEG
jgi:hypothetical protein